MRDDWIKKINNIITSGKVKEYLSQSIISLGNQHVTEYDLLMDTFDYFSHLQMDDRIIDIPNFAKPDVKEMMAAVVAEFKKSQKNDRLVKPIDKASVDDIVVLPLVPEIFHNNHTYADDVVVAGDYDLIPTAAEVLAPGDYGIGEVTAAGRFQINPNEAIIMITDFIDVLGTQNVYRADHIIDDENSLPYSFENFAKFGDINVIPLHSVQVVRINMDINVRVEFNGDLELRPWGIAVLLGENVPDL